MAERSSFSREDIVLGALALLDEVGLDAFTMRALAKRLGTYPATIYWHVGSRAEVLSAAGELVLSEVVDDVPDPHTVSWEVWLAENARAYRRAMMAHPALASWSVTHLEAAVPEPVLIERILGVLSSAGFDGAELAGAFNAYLGSLIGWVGLELIRADAEHGADPDGLRASIAELKADEHPLVVANLDHLVNRAFTFRWSTGADNPLDDAFEFALATWIEGLAARRRGP
jgi:AcrR family transcriptional regulator